MTMQAATTEKTETLDMRVQPFATDFQQRWSWPSLANALLNAAEAHASRRGFGMRDAQRHNYAWVLSRLAIDMERIPVAFQPVSVSTWVKSIFHFFTNRCFAFRDADGVAFGYGHSVWALIDTRTRQPLPIAQLPGDPLPRYVEPSLPCPIGEMGRVRPLPDTACQRTIRVTYGDIDFNGHVNSVRYIAHILDLFPQTDYEGRRNVRRVEVSYIVESHYGDTLSFFVRRIDADNHEVEIRKNHTAGSQGTVVVRAKVRFGLFPAWERPAPCDTAGGAESPQCSHVATD